MKKQSAQSFIQDFLLRAARQNQRLDLTLTTNSVLLRKRLRDMTLDDNLGVFDSYGNWGSVSGASFYRMNIIKPMIKATTAAICSADHKIKISPRVAKNATAEMAAEVCKALRDLKSEQQWTHILQEQLATEPQVSSGVFLKVNWNPKAESPLQSSVANWVEEEFQTGGAAICEACGEETPVDGEIIGEEEFQTIPCGVCGAMAQVTTAPDKQIMDVLGDASFFEAGDTETTVVPSWEIVMDSKGTYAGNIKAARWMVHRYLVDEDELTMDYTESEAEISGALSVEWSYPLRWQHALQTGNEDVYRDDGVAVDSLKEVKDLYLTPQMYRVLELETELCLGKKENPRFFVPAGKGFADGKFNGQSFDKPPVLCFRTVGDNLIDIFPCDFREQFIYISFLSNPSSFWALFLTEMLPLQDVVNYMFTVQIFHTRRNARTTKVLNSGAYNPEDVEKDIVLTKEAYPYDQPIGNTFGVIPSATLSSEPMNLIQTALAVRGEVGGVQPAMMGQSAPSEPYAAQRQQLEQSLGQLLPFSKSIALGKTAWTIRQLKEIQANAPEEDFLFLLKMNSDWTEEYIEAFLKCNLDTDIIIDYEKGSESPRSLFVRELALRQFIGDLAALTQMNPQYILDKPELMDEILSRIAQFSNIGIDVGNTEAEMRVASVRFDKISEMVSQIPPAPDGTPPELIEMMVQQIISMPGVMPSEYEDAGTEIEFYRDKINREMAMDEPNMLLIACCEGMIKQHKAGVVAEGQEDMAMQMAVQAPMMQQQAAMQEESANQDAARQEESEARQAEQQSQSAATERGAAKQERLEAAQLSAMEREHEAELQAGRGK